MINLGKKIGLGLVFFALAIAFPAKAQKLWGEVLMNKSTVYMGEPVEVSVRVYTSTWFTAGVDPGNIKVNGASTVYFRSVSISKKLNGTSFPGVEMIFNVFPFEDEDVVFPSLSIHVESPKDGDYKGKPHIIKTPERLIRVKPVPPGFAKDEWMVTTHLSVNENWRGDLKSVKVGDVLVRKIVRNADNTVSELIPPTVWDSLPTISMYPTRSTVENHKSKTSISATRIENMRYLFEKEGEVVIPEEVYTWWNPYRKKLFKRTLPEVKIDVQPNPSLGMLASIRDSLQAQVNEVDNAQSDKAPPTILGMSLKKFIIVILAGVLFTFILVMFVRRAVRYRKEYLRKYYQSESYYFSSLKGAIRKGERSEIVKNIYRWIDSLEIEEPSIHYFAKRYGTEAFRIEAATFDKQLAKNENISVPDLNHWKEARSRYLKRHDAAKIFPEGKIGWINP